MLPPRLVALLPPLMPFPSPPALVPSLPPLPLSPPLAPSVPPSQRASLSPLLTRPLPPPLLRFLMSLSPLIGGPALVSPHIAVTLLVPSWSDWSASSLLSSLDSLARAGTPCQPVRLRAGSSNTGSGSSNPRSMVVSTPSRSPHRARSTLVSLSDGSVSVVGAPPSSWCPSVVSGAS